MPKQRKGKFPSHNFLSFYILGRYKIYGENVAEYFIKAKYNNDSRFYQFKMNFSAQK